MCLKSISKAAHVLTNHFLPLQIYSPSRKDSGAQQTEESSEKIKAIRGVVTTRVAEVTSLGQNRGEGADSRSLWEHLLCRSCVFLPHPSVLRCIWAGSLCSWVTNNPVPMADKVGTTICTAGCADNWIIPSSADCGKGSQMVVVVVRHGGDTLGEADTTGLGLGSDSDEQSTFQMVVGFFDRPGLYPPKTWLGQGDSRAGLWKEQQVSDSLSHRQAGFAAYGKLLHHLSPFVVLSPASVSQHCPRSFLGTSYTHSRILGY